MYFYVCHFISEPLQFFRSDKSSGSGGLRDAGGIAVDVKSLSVREREKLTRRFVQAVKARFCSKPLLLHPPVANAQFSPHTSDMQAYNTTFNIHGVER